MARGFTLLCTALNAAGHVPGFIRCIENQVRSPDKVVINDDGSTDNILDVLAPYRRSYEIVRLDKVG